jgi:hypothetical protein
VEIAVEPLRRDVFELDRAKRAGWVLSVSRPFGYLVASYLACSECLLFGELHFFEGLQVKWSLVFFLGGDPSCHLRAMFFFQVSEFCFTNIIQI